MSPSDILWLAKEFGVAAGLLAYLFWTENNNRTDRNKRDEAHLQFRRERLEADKDEIESRNRLAGALSALATIITGKPHV